MSIIERFNLSFNYFNVDKVICTFFLIKKLIIDNVSQFNVIQSGYTILWEIIYISQFNLIQSG